VSAAVDTLEFTTAGDRSGAYRIFSLAFTYDGAQGEPFGIPGPEFLAAFDPSSSRSGVSLRAAAHAGMDQSALFEELMRFYEFFGLSRATHAEMPDHLCVELEFMHYLTHLEGDTAPGSAAWRALRRAQHDFLARHLRRLVHGIRSKLDTGSPACANLVDLLVAFGDEELQSTRESAAGPELT
jgi:DMSO reductase family type II enzyme chaperone